jgi:hypothetical protein
MLTQTQVKVILILFDDEGHAEWELANWLKMATSNLNRILKKLVKLQIIFQGEPRIVREQVGKIGDYKEFPYYLSNNLEGLRIMIREIVQSDRVLDTGFILTIIKKCKYIKSMRKKFKTDINKTIADELRISYPPYANPRFDLIQRILPKDGLPLPFLEDDLDESQEKHLERNFGREVEPFEEIPLNVPSALELWYHGYLRKRRDQESSSTDND